MKLTVERIGDKLNVYKLEFEDFRQFLSKTALEKIAAREAKAEDEHE